MYFCIKRRKLILIFLLEEIVLKMMFFTHFGNEKNPEIHFQDFHL